ncbi:class I SAM-dependent methyltransferase [Stutzerimonas nitrititolerans]|uniref:Class I SAM-dependent methyltransferase n=1 Tax=Stutzerimonas nitrititolerans TaxID=2482751 RepID=A0AA41WD24_9GAMM|nr:class I SAM-dependent methyltransferase [Stutzerimonas nitrititolerans]MCO7543261.1 class I SAM-dependent methyltransferase [Stutzerimonas nitrititolerans]
MTPFKGDTATIQYYDDHANDYESSTADIILTEPWDTFTSHIKPNGKILDVGCGGGRDILHFQKLGFTVEAIEPTPRLASIARKKTNAKILEISIQELTADRQFDGVWACASLLHIPTLEIKEAIQKLSNATKADGYIYISLKEGLGEVRKSDGRLFSSFTQSQVSDIIKDIHALEIVKTWVTEDAAHRSGVRWLNILLKKK